MVELCDWVWGVELVGDESATLRRHSSSDARLDQHALLWCHCTCDECQLRCCRRPVRGKSVRLLRYRLLRGWQRQPRLDPYLTPSRLGWRSQRHAQLLRAQRGDLGRDHRGRGASL
eukprot:Amastigsp_a840999_94.p4 type:complete len:116 gc:universal Amastigsp_a840999_94:885-1232(+)